MYNVLTCIFLILFGLAGGIGISIYSRFCENRYDLFDGEIREKSSLKRTIIISIIAVLLMILDFVVFMDYESPALTWLTACFSLIMVYMIVIDFETMYILDRTHIAILAISIIGFIFKLTFAKNTPITSWSDGLFGMLAGGGLFLLIALIANPIAKRKYGNDVQALGYGDVKLMAACGLFVGWKFILLSILIGSIVGVLAQIIIKGVLKKDELNFAFGPYLAIGILASFYFGKFIIDLYLNIIG